jgi:hypothetical protein
VLTSAMNKTKWNELRLEMYNFVEPPAFNVMNTNGGRTGLDTEWYYHFRDGGYETILYVDISVKDDAQRQHVRSALRRVHVPGEETSTGFRVFGYLQGGQVADWI